MGGGVTCREMDAGVSLSPALSSLSPAGERWRIGWPYLQSILWIGSHSSHFSQSGHYLKSLPLFALAFPLTLSKKVCGGEVVLR